jgi:hypothetical protein
MKDHHDKEGYRKPSIHFSDEPLVHVNEWLVSDRQAAT